MKGWWRKYLAGVIVAALAVEIVGFLWIQKALSTPRTAPEAEMALNAQIDLPFQVLIPAYLPAGFDRAGVRMAAGHLEPGRASLVELEYRSPRAVVIVREWMPGSFDQETLIGAQPIEGQHVDDALFARNEKVYMQFVVVGYNKNILGPHLRGANEVGSVAFYNLKNNSFAFTSGIAVYQHFYHIALQGVFGAAFFNKNILLCFRGCDVSRA